MLLGSLFCLLQKLLGGGRQFSLGAVGEELSRGGMKKKETLERSATQTQEENGLC